LGAAACARAAVGSMAEAAIAAIRNIAVIEASAFIEYLHVLADENHTPRRF
jgi:hypothetical protein